MKLDRPYVAVIFTSVRTPDDNGYAAAAARMEELAAMQPGHLGIESARNPDGFGITVSYWSDEDAARAWKQIAEHVEAQRRGRSEWYAAYTVRVAVVTREYGTGALVTSERDPTPS
jgi:heme-degrading monooxygenase HmoA